MGFIRSDSTAVDVSATAPQAINGRNMLRKMIAFADDANEGVTVIGSIAIAGTGYAVGDIVRVADGVSDVGGTAVHPAVLAATTATLEVTSVSGGTVTGLRTRNTGCYSTNPANNGTAGQYDTVALSGGGDDALEVNLTFGGNGWTILRRTQEVDTVAVGANAGLLYSVGDDVQAIGGDSRVGFDSPRGTNESTFNVDSESGGAVTALSILTRGIYHRNPGTDEVATTVLTGSGDNALTVDLTFRDIDNDTTDIEVWLSSSASGAIVGIRSFSTGAILNWEIASCQVFNAALDWEAQVNISPGRYELNDTGQYVIHRNSAYNFFINVTDRRLIGEYNIDNSVYTNMYLGFINAYATTTEHQYPMLVCGCSSRHDFDVTTSAFAFAGFNAAVANGTSDVNGPAAFHTPGGTWIRVRNGTTSGSTILGDQDVTHFTPGGTHDPQATVIPLEDRIAQKSPNSQQNDWESFASQATATGANGDDAPTHTFYPTEGTDDFLFSSEIVVNGREPISGIWGELDGVRWIDRTIDGDVVNAEDKFDDAGDLWLIFNNCKLTTRQHWNVMKVSI